MTQKLFSFLGTSQKSLTPISWLLGFFGVFLIRVFLENLSNPSLTGTLAVDALVLANYTLFFLGVSVSIITMLRILLPKETPVESFISFGMFMLWLPPIIDLAVNGRGVMSYIFAPPEKLLLLFFSFANPSVVPAATLGMRIQIALITLGVGLFVWLAKKDIWRSIVASVLTYTIIFFFGAMPSLMKIAHDIFLPVFEEPQETVRLFFTEATKGSVLGQSLFSQGSNPSLSYKNDIVFSASLGHIFYLIISLVFLIWANTHQKKVLIPVLQNIKSRLERFSRYFILILLGMWLGGGGGSFFENWTHATSFGVLLIAFLCLWGEAIFKNDLYDLRGDKISYPDRPLAKETLNQEEGLAVQKLFAFWSLMGGLLIGIAPLFLFFTFMGISHIYSAPPLRLKKIPIVSTALIGLASGVVILLGFFLVSPTQRLGDFPPQILIFIILAFTIAANLKDLRDRTGDEADGNLTLPVLLGQKRAQQIVALGILCAYLLVPVFVSPKMFWPSLLIGLASLFLVLKKEYKEKPIYFIHLIYLISIPFFLSH